MRYFIVCAVLACAAVQGSLMDKNDKWRRNDHVFKVMDPFYFELALDSSYLANPRKRFASVVTFATSIYLKCNQTDHEKRVKEAVRRTRKELDKPSDALSGVMRAILTELRGIIDKPINDIKISCPPDADQESCDERLRKAHDKNEATCSGYRKNIDMYNRVLKLIENKELQEMKNEIGRAWRISDDDALKYFNKAANGKHSKVMQELTELYAVQSKQHFNCNILNLPIF